MSDPSFELQASMADALKSGVQIVSSRVYDTAPSEKERIERTGAAWPYITFGPCQVLPDKADCIDGAEVYPQIDVWSQAVGFPECKKIAAAVVAALDDQDIQVSGHHTIVFEHQSTNYLRDPDGKTSHAAITFRGLIQPI